MTMDERIQTAPTILAVFGATGDLMAKKIVPALFDLHVGGRLPKRFALVGVSRRDWSDDDLRAHLRAILRARAPGAKEKDISSFLDLAVYHRLEFAKIGDYRALYGRLKAIDGGWGACASKLFYLSVPPRFYGDILDRLRESRLAEGCSPEEGWTRVLVEKPFGHDEKSAKALDARLARLFKEEQIYRIDHYLAKETFRNVLVFRFLNNLFEGEWGGGLIEKIYIREYENIGVEGRGAFYDPVGALRDVGQNHLLQMLALVTMERPEDLSAAAVRRARAAILGTLIPPTLEEVRRSTFRAQYEGYRSIKGVAPRSDTETYFRAQAFLAHPNWQGVPIILEAGKRLRPKEEGEVTEIEVVFRHPKPCACPPGGRHASNAIVFRQDPREEIAIRFWAKAPGHAFKLEEKTIEAFLVPHAEGTRQYVAEYEKLLLDCIAGDQTLFVSSGEVAAMWRFADPILEAWKKGAVPLRRYAPDHGAIAAEAEAQAGSAARAAVPAMPRAIGLYGLGKMGANVARQLREKGWRVVVANRSPDPAAAMAADGFETAEGAGGLAAALSSPSMPASGPAPSRGAVRRPLRVIWLMITAGKGVDEFLFGARGGSPRAARGRGGLAGFLRRGDIVIDAGNSFYEDTIRRARRFAARGVKFVDVGFSGGPSGARRGGSLMVGCDAETFAYLEPLFADLSAPLGYGRMGAPGAGHFVKMVHNGIEYGMMQSLAEGFALMKKSPFKLDLEEVARVYNRGSVIESRLVGWLGEAFGEYGEDLAGVSGAVAATGEGEWTLKTGRKRGLRLPAIESAFKFRIESKKKPSYAGRILSALRNRFGGHSVK